MADNLVMTASVRDDFTATLQRLKSQLQTLSVDSAPVKMRKDWAALGTEVKTAAQGVSTAFLPAMRAGNVLGIGFGATLGAVAVGLKDFASEIRSTSRIAAELKTPAGNIERIMLRAQIGVGMSTQQMTRDLENFQSSIRNLRYDKASQIALIGEFRDVGQAIVNLVDKDLNPIPRKFSELFDKIGEKIRELNDPVRQRDLAKAIFGDPEMARFFTAQIDELVEARIRKFAGAAEKNEEAAKKFNAAWGLMTIAARDLKNEGLGPLLQVTAELMVKYREPIGQGIQNLIANLQRDIPPLVAAMESFGNSSFFKALDKLDEATSSNHLGKKVQELREGWTDFIRRTLGLDPSSSGHLDEAMHPKGGGGSPGMPSPATSQSVDKLNRYGRYLDEAMHPKGASPNAPATELVPLPPRRPRGIGVVPNVQAADRQIKVTEDSVKAVEDSTRKSVEQTKATEDSVRKTEEQTKTTEAANRRNETLTHALDRLRSASDALRQKWDDFVNKLSPDAVVGMGAGGLGMSAGGLGGGGIAGGMGGIGPAGRGGAGMPSGPGGGIAVGSGGQAVTDWMNFLMKPVSEGGLGRTRAQAAGEVASLRGESHSDLSAVDKTWNDPSKSGTPGIAGGVASWRNERFRALQAFAAARGQRWDTHQIQQQFYRHEMLNRPGANSAIMAATTPQEALSAHVRKFEIPGDPDAAIARRSRYLNDLMTRDLSGRAGLPGVSAGGISQGSARFVQENQRNAQFRKLPITNELRGILNEAGAATGLTAQVYSGGQSSRGFGRTGTHRHDIQPGTIGAADLHLIDPQTGRRLNMENSEDRQRAAGFIRETARLGATGFGYGTRYMGAESLHIGGPEAPGKGAAFWGGGHAWVRAAAEEGFRHGSQRSGALLNRASESGINGSPSAKVDARGSVNITLSDSLKDKKVKTDTDGMFKDVQVGRGRPATPPENGPNYDALNRASAGF